ncbi:hypothetical protein ACFY15_30730 [Streptomyces sp. NPDC001373]|uniref:hypothetical protein n=1 Tax=Streptomyces sp. NPDC001373 TaxID=3364565 RepID=UPI0036BF87ED
MDNLHQVLIDYTYTSTARMAVGGSERTVERVFNRFHLLTTETTRQSGATATEQNDYDVLAGKPFDNQPIHFQLRVETIHTWAGDGRVPRTEATTRTSTRTAAWQARPPPTESPGRTPVSPRHPPSTASPDPCRVIAWVICDRVSMASPRR